MSSVATLFRFPVRGRREDRGAASDLRLIRRRGVKAAGRASRFGYVVGVDRAGKALGLYRHGADVVVNDLTDLLPPS